MKEKLLQEFVQIYGSNQGVKGYFAPGRVNLIGEHTDYNGGHVFPCALTLGTYGAARTNEDQIFRFYSLNFKEIGIVEIPLDNLFYDEKDDWVNYPKGVIDIFRKEGFDVNAGIDVLYYGNIPNGSGLSSSASIEVLTGFILKDLFGFDLDMKTNALIGQRAENEFVGMNCGIMDQFAIAMGKKGHAIFLDTATLEYEYVPVILKNAKIVIACSNKKRKLGESKYNERRSQCEAALADLQKEVRINSLGELSEEEFEKYKGNITNPINKKRAKHAVYENQRTIKAVAALRAEDLPELGRLMKASHISLRDDYEVTGIELDTLAESAWKQPGVIGARMTGAGFGGCTVNIVKDDKIDEFIANVGKAYSQKIGYAADFYVAEVGPGPIII